jgi:hypothetical protein
MKKLISLIIGLFILTAAKPSGGGGGWKIFTTNLSRWTAANAPAPDSGDVATCPISSAFANYTALLVTNRVVDITDKTITATFTVSVTSGDPGYVWGCYNCPGDYGMIAAARLYFSSRTDYSNTRNVETYWFASNGTVVNDALGTVTISTTVQPMNWSHGNGCNGSVCLAEFMAAAQGCVTVGVSMGSDHFFDLGIGTTNGTATLHLQSFTVQ